MAFLGDFIAAAQDAVESPEELERDSFGFFGSKFELRDRVGAMTLMRFAAVAVKGVKVGDMEALVAMYDMLEDVIVPGQWDEFQDVARVNAATETQLLEVVKQAVAAIAARPTGRPSDSPDGPSSTTESSRVDSSSSASTAPAGMVPIEELATLR